MKKNTTKKPFVISVLSLLLSVSMLLGTTFAWFTDSVTSGKNKITAGNLDIEVTHSNKTVNGETIQDNTDIFKDVDLWEPGAVAYENFTVKNVGTLALKYSLTLNPYDYNELEGHNLTEVIKAVVIDNATFDGDRDDAKALSGYNTIGGFAKSGSLAPGETSSFTVVLYWAPGETDNLYNANNGQNSSDGNPLFIDFGINVVATQDTVEADSFNNQYDAQAELPVLAVAKIESGKDTVVRAYNKDNNQAAKATIPADCVDGAEKIKMTINETDKPSGITLNTGDSAQSYDVKFFKVSSSGTETQITDFGSENLVSVDLSAVLPAGSTLKQVFHNHGTTCTEMTSAESADSVGDGQYWYDEASKILTVGSTTFSPFTFVTHVHTFKEEWTYDSTNHWHAANCDHTNEISDKAAHVFTAENDATCDCGYIRPIGISVNDITGGAKELFVGDSETFTVTTNPGKITYPAVIWTSSDKNVATVDSNGKVTAIAEGETKIKAEADGKYADFTLTVVKHVTGVTLEKETTTVSMGATETLGYTIEPTDAKHKTVTWSSSDKNIVTVNEDGKVFPVSNGSATVTVTTDDGGFTDTCDVTVITNVSGVGLNKSTASVAIGSTETLTATVYPETATDKTVTWSSSDENVATVENGVVTPKKNGSTTITVTTTDGGFTATCTVTVTTNATGVTLNKSSVTVSMGTTEILTATVVPETATDKTVTWSSSDENVATVENGVVTPKKNGTATITVITTDGGKTASCDVTVITNVTSVSLDKSSTVIKVGRTDTLTATVNPTDASDKTVTWSSSNESVATVKDGVITAKANGSATITVTTADGGKTATCTVYVGTDPVSALFNETSASKTGETTGGAFTTK